MQSQILKQMATQLICLYPSLFNFILLARTVTTNTVNDHITSGTTLGSRGIKTYTCNQDLSPYLSPCQILDSVVIPQLYIFCNVH